MQLLIVRAGSRYNVLPRMSDALTAAFAALGVAARQVELRAEDAQAAMERAVATHPGAWVLAFASLGADFRTPDGASIYDANGCGFVGWDVDHPAYQFARFDAPVARRLQVCASPSHLGFARDLMGARAAGLALLPGVASTDPHPRPLAERPIFVMAAMSWMGEPEVWWREAKGQPAYDLIEGMTARLLADEAADVRAAYDATCAELGMEVRFDRATSLMVAEVARFVRRYDRVRLGDALAAMDVPRLICGRGWRERLGERAHLHFAEDLDADDLAGFYGQARVVVNFNAANGASERAMAAMANGALVVSDAGPLLEAECAASGALARFDRRRPETLARAALDALGAADAAEAAGRGRALIEDRHLWRHRAGQLSSALAVADAQSALAA